jgi:cytosine/adenosine deaminase-related metal-dependent hydrolase
VVLRGGLVLTLDDARRVLPDADVLVIGDRIAGVGPGLEVPEGTTEIDARNGIVTPGMIDTHRHMWQTAMRGLRHRLDPHAVLRLVLPRVREALPPPGRPGGQPARRDRGDLLNPYGHVAFQAQRGDVHTVLVNGRVVKHGHELVGVDLAAARREVEATVEHLRSVLGEEAWEKGMNPDVPETTILDNPYTYTEYHSASTHGR